MEDQQRYLVRFLRGCADAADKKELHVDLGHLLVNGDLMRESADEFEKLIPKEEKFKDATDELHFHLVRAEHHASQAMDVLYRLDNPAKRSVWFKMAIGRAQSILMSAYVRDLRLRR
jgi:hypothetical protein